MKAVYNIVDCCGNLLDCITVELPAGYDAPEDFDAELYALSQSKYADPDDCRECGSPDTRASYRGYPIESIKATVSIEAKDRADLIETLCALLREVQALPDYVSYIVCDGDRQVIS